MTDRKWIIFEQDPSPPPFAYLKNNKKTSNAAIFARKEGFRKALRSDAVFGHFCP